MTSTIRSVQQPRLASQLAAGKAPVTVICTPCSYGGYSRYIYTPNTSSVGAGIWVGADPAGYACRFGGGFCKE